MAAGTVRRGAAAESTVLGLSFDFHDAAAALMVDGRLVAAAEEERLSRRKHDAVLPERAIAACLEVGGVDVNDITHVVFYEKPLLVATRYLAARRQQGLRSVSPFLRDAGHVFGRNLVVGLRVAAALRRLGSLRPPPLQFVEHHMSHAAAAFLASPFDAAAVLTLDGIGEWATATVGVGVAGHVELLEELRYPDSLGLVYSLVTAYCGFRPNDDEYKLMGLAPYGTPRFLDAIGRLAELRADGSLAVDVRRLRWFSAPGLAGEPADLADLFGGGPRRPDSALTQRDADLAASVQRFTEDAVLALGLRAHELTGSTRLCMAGGVALNCVANGKLLRNGPFDEIWIQPAAGDAGSAVGAALALWHLGLGHLRAPSNGDAMSGASLGRTVRGDEAAAELSARCIEYRREPDRERLATEVAGRLADGAVVGWVEGRFEFGPRSLGHRSLLADPRNPDIRERLNRVVKGREDFRPFAPAVLADRAAEWFELDHPSPYMLLVAPVREEHLLDVAEEPTSFEDRAAVARSVVPACTHVDGSARVQTVTAEDHAEFHRLISAFHRLTGCPMVVNTSFNRAGEPIVATVADAIECAREGGVDLLVLDDVLVEGSALVSASLPAET